MQSRTVLIPLVLAALLATPAMARSKRIFIPQVPAHLPTDNREVASDPGDTAIAPLKTFQHRPWLTGSPIATAGVKHIVAIDRANNAVVVLDADTRSTKFTIGVGRMPERLVVASDGMAYVTCRLGRTVDVVDTRKGTVVSSIRVGVEPYGVALNADQSLLLVVAAASGEVVGIKRATLAETFRVKTSESWPAAITASPIRSEAYVTHFHGRSVDVIDTRSGRIKKTLSLPEGHSGLPTRLLNGRKENRHPNYAVSATVTPGGQRLMVAHTMVDTGSTRPVSVSVGGYGMDVSLPVVASMTTFDLGTGEVQRPVVGKRTNDNRRFNRLNTADRVLRRLSQPMAVVHHPEQAVAFIAAMGSDRIIALDTRLAEPLARPLFRLKTSAAPRGIAVGRDGRLFVLAAHAFRVDVFDANVMVAKPDQIPEQAAHTQIALGRDPLPADVARGRKLFFSASDARVGGQSGFACATCHMDGRGDGQVWRSGVGPRQTPILTGRLQGTGPYNWLGSEQKLTDNVHKTVKRLGGSGLKPDEVADLAKFIASYLPGMDNPNRPSAKQVALGRKLFHDSETGCAGCHIPNQRFTDGLAHDVGTTTTIERQLFKQQAGRRPGGPPAFSPPRPGGMSRPIQPPLVEFVPADPVSYNTPGLRYLWASAPYYHDGSAKTLRQLLTTGNKGDRMGKTSHLSRGEIDALVAYLQTL